MKLIDFYEKINAHADIMGIDIKLGTFPVDDEVIVKHISAKRQVTFLAEVIREHTWDTLWKVITQKEPANPLYHVTRVVGYFSRIENWNKSKLGELRDRRKGDYRLPE